MLQKAALTGRFFFGTCESCSSGGLLTSFPIAKPSQRRRSANIKSARCLSNSTTRNKSKRQLSNRALFQSPKRPSDYQGYRPVTPDRSGVSAPILLGAIIIAAAILLSTLVTAASSRVIALDSPNDDNGLRIGPRNGSASHG